MIEIEMNPKEIAILMSQDPSTKPDGGWQNLLVTLQEKVDKTTGRLSLTDTDLERIQKYATYGRGTWENRIKDAFERTLGPKFDGKP